MAGKAPGKAPGKAVWVFGYGSLVWRPGFPAKRREVGERARGAAGSARPPSRAGVTDCRLRRPSPNGQGTSRGGSAASTRAARTTAAPRPAPAGR